MTISKDKTRIGWIGTGVMGTSMFGHILSAGFRGTVFNRTKAKALAVIQKGAEWMESPKLVVESSDIVFTMVGFPEDAREVYFGEEGLLHGLTKDKVIIDMTTTSPSLATEINNALTAEHVFFLDAPVSGGDIGARNAALSIMAGGEKEVFEIVMPLFELLGKKIIYTGNTGSGQHTKMTNQITIASTMIGVCESLIYGVKAGLNPETMLEAISGGAAACWTLNNLAPRILKNDYEPGFYVEHFIKDMGIALDEAKRMGIVLPGLALSHQLYLAAKAKGYGMKGTQALMLVLQEMSGITTTGKK